MKKQSSVICVFFLLALLAGCERPATRSSWAPLNTPQVNASATLPAATKSVATLALPVMTPTPVTVVTLDLNTLAAKYPLASKGYELLTWQKDGQWVFTLLAGTNRQKIFEEILTADNSYTSTEIIKVTVVGEDEFKKLLDHLSKSEWITWGGMDLAGEVPAGTIYFSYPPDETINELVAYCKSLGITLLTLKKE